MSIYRSQYIPKYTPPEERDFCSYFVDLKYKQTMRDHNNYFNTVEVINFDLTYLQCRGDPLGNTENEHYTIQKNRPQNIKKSVKKKLLVLPSELRMKRSNPFLYKRKLLWKIF